MNIIIIIKLAHIFIKVRRQSLMDSLKLLQCRGNKGKNIYLKSSRNPLELFKKRVA